MVLDKLFFALACIVTLVGIAYLLAVILLIIKSIIEQTINTKDAITVKTKKYANIKTSNSKIMLKSLSLFFYKLIY